MRRLTLCASLALLVGASGCRQSDTSPETKITTKDGKTSAVFPGKPSEKMVGDALMHILGTKDGNSAFLLNQNDLPKVIDLSDEAKLRRAFEASRDGTMRGMKGKLLGKKDIKLGQLHGYTYDLEVADGIYRARLYATEKSFIQITVLGPKEFVDGPAAENFLDSLKIEE